MAYDAIITGSHVVLPGGIVDRNIVIDEGRIKSITSDEPQCDERIRADGLLSLPGIIDTHVHYGVYSPIDRAAPTESHAAAVGGVTTMMRMLRLGGSYEASLGSQLEASAPSHHVNYAVHASIFTASQAAEMEYCARAGVSSFKIYMNLGSEIGHVYMDTAPGSSGLEEAHVEVGAGLVEDVVRRAAELRLPVSVHAEDYESCSCAIRESRERGREGLGAWSESRSPEYEAKAIESVCAAARRHGCTVYLVHIGSARALAQALAERARGTDVRVETCPHYLTLSHERQSGNLAKVMPPVRTDADIARIWAALAAGEVDTVGTDHVANRLGPKRGSGGVWDALAGFPGVGTSLPILLSEGVNAGRISVEQLARATSARAAQIFSLPRKGSLEPGSDADVTIADLRLERRVESGMFGGFSDYSVYEGWKLRGWPVRTIVGGKTVADGLEVVSAPGHGRLVSPAGRRP